MNHSEALSVSLTGLRTEDDWQACRTQFEDLESRAGGHPFNNWVYAHELWRTFTPDVPNWLVDVRRGERTVAGALWREYRHTYSRLAFQALRSFDHVFFMTIPPLLATEGLEGEVYRALAAAGPEMRRITGLDMVTLFRLHHRAAEPLVRALSEARIPFREREMIASPRLKIEADDYDDWLHSEHYRIAKDCRRQERRCLKMMGESPSMSRYETWRMTDDEHRALINRYEALAGLTWQNRWQDEYEAVDNDLTKAFTRRAFRIWRDRKLLNVYLLTLGGRDMAYWVTLEQPDRVWALLIGFDPKFEKFSPGKLMFIRGLRSCFGRGLKEIEMGGELAGWKKLWANRSDSVKSLEWGLGGLKSRMWALGQRIKHG